MLSAAVDWWSVRASGTGDVSGIMAPVLFAVASATIIFLIQRLRRSRDEARHALTVAEEARRSAERTSRATEQFVARLSHEWRTPLNAMSLWASQLERRAADADFVIRAAGRLQHAVGTGTRLVSDLLDYTRGTGGKLSIEAERLAIDQPVKRALESRAAEMANKPLTVHVFDRRGDAHVWGDPVRLEQVFTNLLQNAIKFTPPGGTVVIAYVVSHETLQVTVTDTGVGIAADALARILDPFAQSDAGREARHGGLGLGLTIAKEIVELHGGSLTAWSAGQGNGSTFCVHLPLAEARGTLLRHPLMGSLQRDSRGH
jgi:signal transduction histidine kinase